MSQRGDYLNAEKEKLQLKHEENEFKEQIKLLRERLEHFDDPTDENSGKFGIFFNLDQIGPKLAVGSKIDRIKNSTAMSLN